MRLHVANHPLITHKLTVLRDRETPSATFRQLVDELVTLLAYEATREVAVTETPIETPVAPTVGLKLSEPRPIVVPVLRAGLGMLEGMTRMLPTAEVGFLGMRRDEDTLEIETYANRLPEDLSGRQCFILDPMLATGHTMVAATNYLFERGGLGQMAINYGYNRWQDDVMISTVVAIIVIVQIIQLIGDLLSRLVDHRAR